MRDRQRQLSDLPSRRVRALIGAALFVPALVLTACGSSTSAGTSSSSTSAAAPSSEMSSSSASSAGDSSSAAPASSSAATSSAGGGDIGPLSDYEAQPTFTAPGPAFNAKAASGKTVWVIPTTSQVSVVPEVEEAMKTALQTVGVKTQLVTTSGQVSEWVQGMTNAVAQKADAIVLLGIDPKLIGPQIAAAAAAKIPVVYTFAYQGQPLAANVTASAAINYPTIAKVLIKKALADTNNDAHIMVIKAPELAPQTAMTATMTAELAKDCPSCTIEKVLDEPIASWSTKINSDTRTSLLGNSKINVIIPLSDSMNEWVVPAVRQTNNLTKIKIYSVDATPSIVQQIGKGPIVGDMGYSNQWVGWASADQALRLITGTAPGGEETIPSVLFDAANIAKATGDLSSYYGNPYEAGYKQLWGAS